MEGSWQLKNPYDFLTEMGFDLPDKNQSLDQYLNYIDEDMLEDIGTNKEMIYASYDALHGQLEEESEVKVKSILIKGGFNKDGEKEPLDILLKPGEIVSIVGPTGSGKSRLLADIEWLAQADTPTGRVIVINGILPDESKRYSFDEKLISQLSQNMNFVMDANVEEFIRMHAESRNIKQIDEVLETIIKHANDLAGEPFSLETPLTALSGGQSRALMIVDVAFLSKSPIVLIDEIENAGIDRRKAMEFLVNAEKIILIATHDPVLALMANRRLVIRNGGMYKIIESDESEKKVLEKLEKRDRETQKIRNALRAGQKVQCD
ncbi:ATP-binding cassette domain-containing protein [Acetobacterium paludosum]|uniref:ATP-binding cassette domain-containing protein n=1 Tax=Acetobacterium paludosum TaxID=52693 RepID=A0A923HZ06_9FIRM|nr:ATP-binding cassette domain-containing protein [Acetobacterium paludosum]MBC3887158.1 ATP-binding cassette domain-containing protein [Acetobacterium paludosum]